MPDTREKLIKLLEADECPLLYVLGENMGALADYLLAHGVTIQKLKRVIGNIHENAELLEEVRT